MSWPIKFRAWDKQEKKFAKLATILFRPQYGGNTYELGDTQKDRLVIQLWTGLADKNGREIYEGDILKNEKDDDIEWERMVVIYHEETAHFNIALYNPRLRDGRSRERMIDYYLKRGGEVIGNIYENPELLKPVGV